MQKIPIQDKSTLRTWAKQVRKGLPLSLISKSIWMKLKALSVFQQAKTVLGYFPMNGEVDLLPLMHETLPEKNWYLPRCKMDSAHQPALSWHRYRWGDSMDSHPYGMQEPLATSPELKAFDKVDLVIVPGLVFDRQGYRLGYGKGYYDRFFTTYPFLLKKAVGLCPEALLLADPLPRSSWDLPLGQILTDREIYLH